MVAEISIDISQMIDFGQGLMVSERVVAEELRIALVRSAAAVERDAKANVVVDQGHLRRSIATEIEPFEAKIGSNLQYARPVEEGRGENKPMPPKGSLLGWMARHNIPAELEFYIRKRIGERGIPARPFLVPALEANRRNTEREFAIAADRINKRLVS